MFLPLEQIGTNMINGINSRIGGNCLIFLDNGQHIVMTDPSA